MTTWAEIIRSQLDAPFWEPGHDPVPFGLPPVPGDAWRVHDLAERDGAWRLSAHTGTGLEASFSWRGFPDTRAIECWGEISHRGTQPVAGIERSYTLDTRLRLTPDFDRPWVRAVNGVRHHPTGFPPHDFAPDERQMLGAHMYESMLRISSGRDARSSGKYLPCAILGNEPGTAGLAFFLEWSGMWWISFDRREWGEELLPDADLRVRIGLDGLVLDLRPGETLPLPRLVVTAYSGDLEAGGNSLRRHIRRHVTPKLDGAETLPPATFNTWFAFEQSITADFLKPGVDASAAAGLEYFVVDAGWFAGGLAGLGDWDVDRAKFPDEIEPFAEYVRGTGMGFGIWFEPERVVLGSPLAERHPDWLLLRPEASTEKANLRNTAMVDFGNPEVRAFWIERFLRAYDEWGLRWLRWDFNMDPRPNWDDAPLGRIGLRQIAHVLGYYEVLDRVRAECPDLFIEHCAGGGYRIDLGTVRRGHSFFMNDVTEQTDLVRAFQHGLNQVLPGNYPNTNLCQPRTAFTEYDYLSHMTGAFGYSGALWEWPRADFATFANAVARFKEYRHLLLGDYARPTGQPRRADEYARVDFSDGPESVTFEYNHDGPGTARLTHRGR